MKIAGIFVCIWDLYNENRELLGKDHVRGEQLPIDGYHLVVHMWIRESKGQYLISQRSANRPTHPLMPENGQVLFTKTQKIIEGKIFNDIMDVWMNREQINELFDANIFVDTLEYFFTEVDKPE